MSIAGQLWAASTAARTLAGLDDVVTVLWRGHAAKAIGDDEAQRLAEHIEDRRRALRSPRIVTTPSARPRSCFPLRRLQRSPDRAASIARRRRLAASGPLPPSLAAHYTTGEQAVLRIVADEVRLRGACDRSLAEIAARAGVSRTLAHDAMRKAERDGLVSITERRLGGPQRNLTNLVRIVSSAWAAWLKLTKGGVFGKSRPTDTQIHNTGTDNGLMNPKRGLRGRAGPAWEPRRSPS